MISEATVASPMAAALTGTDGHYGPYSVIPVERRSHLWWLDPAGFELATTRPTRSIGARQIRSDFETAVSAEVSTIERRFRPA
jgi:hypothetical protein